MTQWVIKKNGQIVPHRTMRRLTPNELLRDLEVKKRAEFDGAAKLQYGGLFTLPK